MAAPRRTYARRAMVFLAASVVAVVAAAVIVALLPDGDMKVTMHTDVLAGGITPGSSVVLNGAEIGHVTSVAAQGPDRFDVGLAFDKGALSSDGLLTSTTQVTYAPKNLFGIAAVVLKSTPGGTAIGDGGAFYPDQPVDATLTTLLRNLSDLQNEAFEPYMGKILNSANTATMGLLPVVGVIGKLVTDIADTQRIPTAQSLPQFAAMVRQLRAATGTVLPSLMELIKWQAPQTPGYVDKQYNGFDYVGTTTMADVGALLSNKELGQLITATGPVGKQLIDRVITSFPQARRNGIQIATLIDRIDAALRPGPRGPVMTVDVVLAGIPGIAAALGVPGGTR